MIPVVWLNFNEDAPNRGYWDQGLLEDLFAGSLWRVPGWPGFTHHDSIEDAMDGAVVVVPGRQNAALHDRVQAEIQRLNWVLLIVTGDEENEFPLEGISHRNVLKWVMTPNPDRNTDCAFALGSGYPPGMPQFLAENAVDRAVDWFFAGQVTHDRRERCRDALRATPGGILVSTEGFTQGLPQQEYWQNLSAARVAPCPGGPISPDSFRLFEALEAGCIPLADAFSGRNVARDPKFWGRVFGTVPFPVIRDWAETGDVIAEQLQCWNRRAAEVGAWWLLYKRRVAETLLSHVSSLSGQPFEPGVEEGITVIVPTSVIPDHPSTSMIEETIRSVREQLSTSEIIIMCDGIRSEQADRRADYDAYLASLVNLCLRRWDNVLPVIFGEHLHQGVMARITLHEYVRTQRILYVEHDAPIFGEIPWAGLSEAVDSGAANIIRLHHEALILEPHKYLMLADSPLDVCGVPLMPTVQWSQRPHIANTGWYKGICDKYFGMGSRTMIEDVMYGVLETHWREEGRDGWDKFRLFIYAPEGDMKRSGHLDGRGNDPKYSMLFDYDTEEEPKWAPFKGVRP